jgi:hypothetical protein
MNNKRIVTMVFVVALAFVIRHSSFVISTAHAGDLQFSPAVIDLEGEPRTKFPMDITVTNGGKRSMEVYPYVAEFNPENGSMYMPSGPSENNQLASTWTEIPREGFTLDPGESKTLSFKISVSPYAQPHPYYVAVAFPEGDDMYDAHSRADTADRIIATIRVTDPVVHKFNLLRFAPLKRAFLGFPANLTAVIANGGNAPDTLRGSLRVFNRRGEEVGNVGWDTGNAPLEREAKQEVGISWSGNGGFGRYKAYLEARYGDKGEALITDTVYFWVLPWYVLAALGATVLAISMFAAWWAQKHSKSRE